MQYFTGLALLASFLIGCGVVPSQEGNMTYKGYETPAYTILEKHNDIEVRLYGSRLLAEVEVTGDRDKAINDGFRILAGYIFGNNLSREKISMTTPVSQSRSSEKIAMTTPVVQSGALDRWNIEFTMPSKYTLDTLPSSKDARIQFRIARPVKKAVIRFSGPTTKGNLSRNLGRLEDFIKKNKLSVQQPPFYEFYDAPWTLPFMRRNEIAFIVMDPGMDRDSINDQQEDGSDE